MKIGINDQIKISWPFAVAVLIFGVLAILQVKGIYKNDVLFGAAYIFTASTFTYSSFKGAKLLRSKGSKSANLLIYASGVLSGVWLLEAIKLLF